MIKDSLQSWCEYCCNIDERVVLNTDVPSGGWLSFPAHRPQSTKFNAIAENTGEYPILVRMQHYSLQEPLQTESVICLSVLVRPTERIRIKNVCQVKFMSVAPHLNMMSKLEFTKYTESISNV